ncbi:MAG: BMP family ABC transporter substrate-binding protein [Candidatus Fimisoma sp.]|nr:BMP family ABC transporter substrate-binding protein [Bacillota bacterium]MDD7285114.1 BMP family ABC transporter substrate-binding protein [Bacillota bacterium]MDY4747376.1 BMP family ABC transporter substrate-binding protein [Candidatus Fimisoma sp.]
MKKTISLLLVFAMILSAFALTGCSKDNGEGEELTVSIVVSSAFGDKSFNDSAKEGADKLAQDYGVKIKTIECQEENFKQYMVQAAEESDIVVPVGWQFYEIPEVAKEYPDTKFIWVDNEAEGIADLPNVLCITYAQNEGSFLAGYIAAKMSQSGVVGAVGGEQNTTIDDFIVGYKQGALYANPDIKVVTNYANTYEDPAKGKECALALHNQGADVIFQIAGNTGNGVFAAAQEAGFYAIGVDQDQKISAPEYDKQIICSMKKEVGLSIYDTIKTFIEEEKWEGARVWTADMATGYVSIAYGNEDSEQQISDAIKSEVEEIAGKIVSGDIVVDTTRQ